MRLIVALVFSFLFAPVAEAGEAWASTRPGPFHQWVFPSEPGNISVALSAEADGGLYLEIDPENMEDEALKPDTANRSLFGERLFFTPKLSDEVHFLEVALAEMPSLGYKPTRLKSFSTWLQRSVFREEVEVGVYRSGIWKRCVRRYNCSNIENIATIYLERSKAYQVISDVFRAHGIKIKTVAIDEFNAGYARRGPNAGKFWCGGWVTLFFDTSNKSP